MALWKKLLLTGAIFLLGLKSYSPMNSKTFSKDLEINKIYLTSGVNGGVCSNNSKNIKLEDIVKLNLVVESKNNGKKMYFSKLNNLEINGAKIDSSDIKPWNSEAYSIKWFKIEAEKDSYNNWEKGRFEWDTPIYKETLINAGHNWTIFADAHPTDEFQNINKGLGTMRYKVEFLYNDLKFSTKGKESTNYQGITKDVHRISFRKDDSFVGWLTSFFNLPYIYGSVNSQADNYVGVDCADLIVGAYRKKGHKISYTYAAGLSNIFSKIVDEKDISLYGEDFYNKEGLLKYGKDVNEGDLILFGKWHVGTLVEDKSNSKGPFKGKSDRILNTYDLMIHTLFASPCKSSIGNYGPFSILKVGNN